MKVNFFATLRDIAGGKTVEFDLEEGVTAKDLLDTIVTRFPLMKKELLDMNGRMYGHVHLFINGRDVQNSPPPRSTNPISSAVTNSNPAPHPPK